MLLLNVLSLVINYLNVFHNFLGKPNIADVCLRKLRRPPPHPHSALVLGPQGRVREKRRVKKGTDTTTKKHVKKTMKHRERPTPLPL